jgi:hypothetical protein
MLHTRWSAEAWAQIRVEFNRALALRREIRRAGWFIDENVRSQGSPVGLCPGSSVRQSSIRLRSRMVWVGWGSQSLKSTPFAVDSEEIV